MADSEIRIIANASPAISELDKLTSAADKSDQSIEKLTKATGRLSVNLKDRLVASSNATVSATKSLIQAFSEYSRRTQKVDTQLTSIKNVLRDWNSLSSKNTSAINSSVAALNNYSEANIRVKRSLDTFKQGNAEVASSLVSVQRVVEKTNDDLLGYQTRIKAISESGKITARDLSILRDTMAKIEARSLSMTKATDMIPGASTFTQSASGLKGISAQLREATSAATALSNAQDVTANSITKLQSKYMKVGDSLAIVRGEFDKLKNKDKDFPVKEAQVKALEREYTALGNSLDKMMVKYDRIKEAARNAALQQQLLGKELSIAGTGTATLKIDSRATLTAIEQNKKLAAELMNTARTAATESQKLKLFDNGLLGLGSSARSVVYSLNAFRIAFNLLFAASGIGLGIRLLAQYDQEMSKVEALTWDATKPTEVLTYEMERLNAVAQKLGATTRFTAKEAATAMTSMAQAGLTVSQIIEASSNVLNLAVAADMSLANASDVVVKSMTMFGYTANETTQIVDALAAGANKSVTNVEELSYALKYVGPIAHTMNISLNDTIAALGALSNAGINASMAGTGLRRIISEIMNPTKKAAGILAQAGLTMEKLDIAGKGLIPVLQNIADANLSVGDTFAIWGDRGAPVLRAIINNMDDLVKLQRDLSPENIEGYAENLAKIMDDNLLGGWKNFVSAIQDFIIKTGEVTGATEGMKDSLFAFASAIRSFNADMQNTGPLLLSVGAAIAAFLISMGKVKDVSGLLGTQDAVVRRWALAFEGLSFKAKGTASVFGSLSAQVQLFAASVRGATVAQTAANVASAAWAGTLTLLRGAMALLIANWPLLLVTALAGGLTYLMTSTNKAEQATEKYAKALDMMKASSDGARVVTEDFEAEVRKLSKTELQLAQEATSRRIDALKNKISDLILEMDKTSAMNFGMGGYAVFSGMADKEAATAASSIENVNKALEVYQNLDISGKTETEKNAIKNIIATLKTLQVAWMEANAQKKQYSENQMTSEMSNSQNKLLIQAAGLNAIMKEIDLKPLYTESEKLDKQLLKLGANLPTEEASQFYAVISKFEGLENFFDIDPTNMTVKIKNTLKDMDKTLRTVAMEAGDTKTIHMLDTLWDALNNNAGALTNFADKLRQVKEAKIDTNIRNLATEFQYLTTNVADSQIGTKIRDQLASVFGKEIMSNYSLVYKDTFDEMKEANKEFFNNTSDMAQKVLGVLRSLFGNIQTTQKQTLESMIARQNILLSIPAKQRKEVEGFAGSTPGVDLKKYDVKTGAFGGENADLINEAYRNYLKLQKDQMDLRSSNTKKEAKFNQNIANQIDELRIKYKEYQLQVTGGYKGEIEEQKIALQMLKEKASLLTQAAGAGVSQNDPRILQLQEEIDKTYKLLQLDAKRKAMEEESLKPYERRAALAKELGVAESSAELALLRVKMELLNANQLLEQSEAGRAQKAHERQMYEAEISNIERNRAEAAAQLDLQYQQQLGWASEIKAAQIAIYDLDIKRLQTQLAIAKAAKDEYEVKRLQKELSIAEKTKSNYQGSDVSGGLEGFLNAMGSGYQQGFNDFITGFNEVQFIAQQTQGVFDSLTDSLVTFITTGKLDFKKMLSDISMELAKMFAKLAIMKAVNFGASFFGGLFHDGGRVGSTSTSQRAVNPMVFAGAHRYHDGGQIGGLRADERPAILQTGERVLNRSESSTLDLKMSQMVTLLGDLVSATREGGSSATMVSPNIVLVDDDSKVKKYLYGPEGSKAFVHNLNQNRATVQNVAKGGRG